KSDEMQYMLQRRNELGGFVPSRVVRSRQLSLPGDAAYASVKRGSGAQPVATTMALVRLIKDLIKDPGIGHRLVPIIPDEARTFGLDALFPTKKIYSPHGQTYTSVDRELFLSYKEARDGQILHEGITEAGATASWTAAGTSYATHDEPMIPLYIFYSMFGFQRTGDGLWAAADQMARGFLLGATAGRTTLNGEGLQHQDGHSLLLAATNPACLAYDAAYAYELGHIIRDGLRRMYGEPQENIFYYLTLYNEPILQPAEPDDVDIAGIVAGMHRLGGAGNTNGPAAHILASGIAVPAALAAQRLLHDDWGVHTDVWSVTSWTELRREALDVERWNVQHPDEPARIAYVTRRLQEHAAPVLAVSDWMRAVPDQIARFVPGRWASLGTDGFGRSDTRTALRRHYGTDETSIALRVIQELAATGLLDGATLGKAQAAYDGVTLASTG
ncbi:transketolase-like TK C-terminal-containing protein, partial [Paractinoplanes rishiriensis]|uniref:transketolase-like TK C-terminal-containing protein n=1 Tax=Paractinoplanes rishiriensis TaxID=1050105 RepID=UPI003F692B54